MKKKIIFVICILAFIIAIAWAICALWGSNRYEYDGFITNIYKNNNGETVFVTLSDSKESEFTVKWYTQNKTQNDHQIKVGDRIMLSTTLFSNTNIKKFTVKPGYFTEGRLVYIDISGSPTPFVLSIAPNTGMRYLVSIITHEPNDLATAKTGDLVRFYHTDPTYMSSVSVIAEEIIIIDASSSNSLTQEDIAFVESKGYIITNLGG